MGLRMYKVLIVDTTQYAPLSPLWEGAEIEGVELRLFDVQSRRWWKRGLNRAFIREIASYRPHMVIVVAGGANLRARYLKACKGLGSILVRWNLDDPWNPCVQSECLTSMNLYDVYVTCKRAVLKACLREGLHALYVPCGYKPSLHRAGPDCLTDLGGVAMICGADDERANLARFILHNRSRCPFRLIGPYWERYPDLIPWKLPRLDGESYRRKINELKVVLNPLRYTNRDAHNMRSFEIPACGGVQLTRRTDEHEEFLEHGISALLYRDHREMLELLDDAMCDDALRAQIREQGPRAVQPYTWASRLEEIINACREYQPCAG